MIRVLIADDHNLFREGLTVLLEAAAATTVVGQVGTGTDAIAQADALTPDIILMDIDMPDMNGLNATRRILADHPGIGIIMLTMLEDDDSLFAAMSAGARGYILKGADKAEVLRTIEAVAGGEAHFGPTIANQLTGLFRRSGQMPQADYPFPELTEREREVLVLIADGLNNAEIAHRLTISGKTVSNHISNILSKLEVTDRSQAIVKARTANIAK